MVYDLIGTIYKPSGVMLTDAEGNEYPEMVAVDGYHVNTVPESMDDVLQAYLVTPATPSRVFAGRDDTVSLKFKDRDEWLSLGYEVIMEEIE